MKITHEAGKYVLYKEKTVIGTAALEDGRLWVEIDPAWRQRGYGSYLVKEILQQNGGYDVKRETLFTAGPAADEAAGALLKKFGFLPQGGEMVRRRVPDLSAVQLCHEFLTAHLQPGGLYVDATCGNGHDTEFLCRLAGPTGRVLALDIQPAAVENTNTRLGAAGLGAIGQALVHDHARLAELVAPGTADCVLFNFGWLPGADHEVHSTADGSLPALQAALDALKPRGVLAAVLAGLILAGILAATMSTADSQMLAAASSVSQNILQEFGHMKLTEKQSLFAARLTIICISVVGVVLARDPNSSVFGIVSFAWAGFGGSFGAVVLCSLFWKRCNWQGALAGMLSGGLMVFVWKYIVSPLGGVFGIYELLPAFLMSLVVCVVVSLVTPAPSAEIEAEFDAAK